MPTLVRPSQFWDHTRDLSLPHHRRKVDELAASIAEHGYHPEWADLPINVGTHDGEPWIDNGHHRLKALQQLGDDTPIPMEVSHHKTAAEEDWQNPHRPPDADYGAPLHDLEGMLPDFYNHPHYYHHGTTGEHEATAAAMRVRGRPEAKVRIFRALPAEHAHQGFQPGDWVSTSKEYALEHARQNDDPKHDWPVIRTTVQAQHLHTAGDLTEYGYSGPQRAGQVSHKGGYHQEVRQHADGVIRPVQRRQAATEALTLAPSDRPSHNRHLESLEVHGHGLNYGEDTRVYFKRSHHPDLNHQLNVSRRASYSPPPHPMFPNNERREDIGHLSYHPETGRVAGLLTEGQFQRKGVASAMWNIAVGLHEQHGLVRPQHSEIQTDEGREWAAKNAKLSDEGLVSVAEHAMEQSGHAGRTWHVPKMHADDPARREAHQPVHDFVRGVLAQHGYEHAQGIHVSPSHWDLREPGSGQAMVNAMGTIGLKGEHTNDMTLLHECAHILTRTPEGPGGHGPDFQQAAHRLYHDHISPEAADTFNGVMRLGDKQARALPHQRVFGPTFGLDKRLWEPSGDLKSDVRVFLLRKVGHFLTEHYGPGWEHWARIYFAGSEASMWTGPELVGNNDFDTLIGINYPAMRKAVPALAHLTNSKITDMLNYALRTELRDPAEKIEIDGVQTGPWDATFYVNPDSWDIRKIKPYAAFDVGANEWVVKPPDLPQWSLGRFPKTVLAALKAAERYARDVLRLSEPQRTQQGAALFEAWHSDRSRAFSDRGQGWWDFANLREKFLDQTGVWKQLVDCKHRDDQGLGAPLPGWLTGQPFGMMGSGTARLGAARLGGVGHGMAGIAGVVAVTDKWPPYLTEKPDEYGDKYPVNESRANPRGPVMSEPDAKAAGYVGPYFHGTNKRRARDIRRGGFRQPRMHNWEMEGAGNAEEVDLGHTHRTFFTTKHEDALHFARGHHGDDADVVKAYLHPDHMSTEEGGGWMPSVQVKDVAHAVAIHEPKTAAGPSRLERAWGSRDENTLFGDAPTAPAPWPGAGRRKDKRDYDPDLVKKVITEPEHHHMQDVDPRTLRATQPSITRGGVRHYLSDHYDRTGETFSDHHNPGNRRPVVYQREDGQNLLLSGHHRATAALLQGKPLQALVVNGPWGAAR